MRRIVFINGHCNDLLMTTMSFYLLKQKVPCKYIGLLREILSRGDVEVVNFVTPDGIYCKPSYVHLPFSLKLAKRESNYVLKKNGLKGIKTITSIQDIRTTDVVIGYLMARFGCEQIQQMNCRRYIHLNQYYCFPIDRLNSILPYADGFILEANVFDEGNYILKSDLPDSYRTIITPFIVQDRFVNRIPFEERKNKALATGTIGPCNNPDYVAYYGTNLIHKMRQVIFDHREELSDLMDVTISPYVEEKEHYDVRETDSKLVKLLKILLNTTLYRTHGQKKYFSFDIVSKYNEYQMSIVPEEICGIPGIGAFEAMACGCALIAINHHLYTDLGLIPGVHYVEYDGSLDGLIKTCHYYQSHTSELKAIAHKGEEFIKSHFNKERITEQFLIDLFQE